MLTAMHFYVTRSADGLLHVQNTVGALEGQHHVHSEEGFAVWREGIADEHMTVRDGECSCGLASGDVRDHGGNVWHNERFE